MPLPSIVGDDLARDLLVPRPPKWQRLHIGAMIIYPTHRLMSTQVHTLTECLQQEFAGNQPWDRRKAILGNTN